MSRYFSSVQTVDNVTTISNTRSCCWDCIILIYYIFNRYSSLYFAKIYTFIDIGIIITKSYDSSSLTSRRCYFTFIYARNNNRARKSWTNFSYNAASISASFNISSIVTIRNSCLITLAPKNSTSTIIRLNITGIIASGHNTRYASCNASCMRITSNTDCIFAIRYFSFKITCYSINPASAFHIFYIFKHAIIATIFNITIATASYSYGRTRSRNGSIIIAV